MRYIIGLFCGLGILYLVTLVIFFPQLSQVSTNGAQGVLMAIAGLITSVLGIKVADKIVIK
jgi:hypothetical protein